MLQIKINDHVVAIKEGVTIGDLLKKHQDFYDIYGVSCQGEIHDLNWIPNDQDEIELIDKNSEIGKQIYEYTLSFLFIAAVKRCFPDVSVNIEHSFSNGLFCSFHHLMHLSPTDVKRIEDTMYYICQEKLPILKKKMTTKDAIALFEKEKQYDKAQLLKTRNHHDCQIYTLDGINDYFNGSILLGNTSYIDHFTIRYYAPGIWLSGQEQFVNQAKLFQAFQQFEEWGHVIGVNNVAEVNRKIKEGKIDDLVLISETLIERKLWEVADAIVKDHPDSRFILIAGPSSAGKTTFSRRLSLHLKVYGKESITLSMDDFYKNRENTPKLPDGSYDFESPEAIDLELFNDTLLKLLNGESCQMPYFDFKTGTRQWKKERLKLEKDQLIIIEGIHGLNPKTTERIPAFAKFKIYINALTHLNLDNHNRIATSDYRLIRRITRDHQFRGWPAIDTIRLWKNVRNGEDKYIYPYQEEADIIFNSSMLYELNVLKRIVIPLLDEISVEDNEYLIAQKLKNLLEYFIPGDTSAIPRTSILAEFIGNSIFDVN